jgi:hypothetical protein
MSDTMILGTRKGLLIFEHANRQWKMVREAHTAIPISYAATDPRSGTLWACLDHGHWAQKLHRSPDMGETWEEVPAPKYPEGEETNEGAPATTSYLWTITPGGVDQPDRLYIGTEPGGLFHSDDSGDSFRLVETLWNHPTHKGGWFGGGRDHPGLCSICVDPRDNQHIHIGISVGGVYETFDGGETWEPRNKGLKACYLPNPDAEVGHDPHFMIASPANPDVLWQQNHCGVFRSVDGAQTWQDVSQADGPVYFGFALAVDEQDPDTAWVVPAVSDELRVAIDRALCVGYTEDGGKTWTDFRSGLPQEDCYDIVFRHALDISGNRLAFGTTTGNVYVSDDRGESWRCIAHHLPPVYSVRFT